MLEDGRAFTVPITVETQPFVAVYEIVVVPDVLELGVIDPELKLIVATLVFDEDQVPPEGDAVSVLLEPLLHKGILLLIVALVLIVTVELPVIFLVHAVLELVANTV